MLLPCQDAKTAVSTATIAAQRREDASSATIAPGSPRRMKPKPVQNASRFVTRRHHGPKSANERVN